MKSGFPRWNPLVYVLIGIIFELFYLRSALAQYSESEFARLIAGINSDRFLSSTAKEREIRRLMYSRDSRVLVEAGRNQSLKELIETVNRIKKDWEGAPPDDAVYFLSGIAATLLDRRDRDSLVSEQVISATLSTVELLPKASLNRADEALSRLALQKPSSGDSLACALDSINPEIGLTAYLRLQQRAATYLSIPFEQHVAGFDGWKQYRDSKPLGTMNSVELLALQQGIESKVQFDLCETQWKYLTGKPDWSHPLDYPKRTLVKADENDMRRPELMARSVAAFAQTRFTMEPADLRKIQRALDQNITDPKLRDRLVQLIFRGQNPFLALPEDSVSAGGGPSLKALTRKTAASGQGALANGDSRGAPASASAPTTSGAAPGTPPRSLPYIPLAGVLATGLALWWFISRSRGG